MLVKFQMQISDMFVERNEMLGSYVESNMEMLHLVHP